VKHEDEIERSVVQDEVEVEKEDLKRHREKLSDERKSQSESVCLTNLEYSPNDKKTHFTRIELEQVRNLVQKKLSGRYSQTIAIWT